MSLIKYLLATIAILTPLGESYRATTLSVVPDQQLISWGYKTTELKYPLTYCDSDVSGRSQRDAQSIRSTVEVKAEPSIYYRYTLIRERYISTQAAQNRLDDFRLPSRKDVLYSKTCELRVGFRHGEEVYIVHTDVSQFTDAEQQRLLKLFKLHIVRAGNE